MFSCTVFSTAIVIMHTYHYSIIVRDTGTVDVGLHCVPVKTGILALIKLGGMEILHQIFLFGVIMHRCIKVNIALRGINCGCNIML